MPTFEVTSPDGRKFRVNAPEGATQADAIAYIQAKQSAVPADVPAPSPATAPSAAPNQSSIRNVIGGYLEPLAAMVTGAVAKPVSDVAGLAAIPLHAAGIIDTQPENVKAGVQRGMTYEPRTAAGKVIEEYNPLALLAKGVDWVGSKAEKGIESIPLPKGAQPFQQGAAQGIHEAINQAPGVLGAFAARAPKPAVVTSVDAAKAVTDALTEKGIDVSALPTNVITKLIEHAKQTLSSGQPLDNEAVMRATDYASLNIKPLAGQLSRDPAQFAFEQNVSGVKGVGDEIANRLGTQNRQLIANVQDVAPRIGDKLDTGQSIISGLQSEDAIRKAGVKAAYDKAATTVGSTAEVPMGPLAQRVGQVIEEHGAESIPGAVLSRLKSYGVLGEDQTRSFTIQEADRLRHIINENRSNDPVRLRINSKLLGGIDDSVGALAEQGATFGPEAATAFGEARKTAAARFKLMDRVPALKAVAEGDAVPDNFFDKFVRRANVSEVEGLKELVKARPEIVDAIRGQIIDSLHSAATGGKSAEYAQFGASNYNKALADIGDRKLSMFFSPEEMGRLRAVGRVALSRSAAPTGAPVNYSKSGSALLDFANRMGLLNDIPGIGHVIKGVGNIGQKMQARESLNAHIPDLIGVKANPLPIKDAAIEAFLRKRPLIGAGLLGASGSSNQ